MLQMAVAKLRRKDTVIYMLRVLQESCNVRASSEALRQQLTTALAERGDHELYETFRTLCPSLVSDTDYYQFLVGEPDNEPSCPMQQLFNVDDMVLYLYSPDTWLPMTVTSVHNDDPGNPYYTINGNGIERQTEGTKLKHL